MKKRLEFRDGSSDKFWEIIEVLGSSHWSPSIIRGIVDTRLKLMFTPALST